MQAGAKKSMVPFAIAAIVIALTLLMLLLGGVAFLVLSRPQASTLDGLWLLIAATLVIDLAAGSGMYFLLSRRVQQPLQRLREYTVAVSNERPEEALLLTQPLTGEFAALGLSLRHMVAVLETKTNEMKGANNQFWRMASGIPVAIAIYSPDSGRVFFVNEKFTRLLGFRREDIPQIQDWFASVLCDGEQLQSLTTRLCISTENAIHGLDDAEALTMDVTCKSGEIRTVEIGSVLAGGYVITSFNDVTEQKRAHAQLEAQQTHLEELVEARTRELVIARNQAESANRAKSTFLAHMSHELRTPLNSIIGYSRLMLNEQGLEPRQQRNLEIIQRSGHHLLSIISDILELSKIEAGRMDIASESIDPGAMLNEVADMLNPRALQSGLYLQVETVDLPAYVQVDAPKLRQILLNLATNALKFTREGGVLLEARGHREGADQVVTFSVSDTGVGIAPEDQQRVFEPFVQLDHSPGNTGAGLGLAICREYVQMLGGTLALTSTPDKGTTIGFTLKLAEGQPALATAPAAAPAAVNPRAALAGQLSGHRVLIVDDTQEIRMLLRDLLEPMGLLICEADNGQQALTLILEKHPHFVLLDWRMPGLSGIELTRLIRHRNDIPQPHVIMMSANAYKENQAEALAAGVDHFMTKPVAIQALVELMEHCCATPGASAQPLATPVPAGEAHTRTRQAIDQLSEPRRTALTDALRELNPAKIREAIDAIRAENSLLAEQIDSLFQALKYRELWQLFKLSGSES